MGFFSSIGRSLEKAGSAVGHAAEKAISIIPHQSAADKRAQQKMMDEQMQYYQTQKDMMASESARLEGERNAERTKIQEKQIRSMRRAYRAPGFLEPEAGQLSNKLG